MWKLCVAVTLSLSLMRGVGAQGVAFFDGGENLRIYKRVSSSSPADTMGALDGDKACDARTPPNRFVFPVDCQRKNLVTMDLECKPIAFSVIINQTNAKVMAETDYRKDDSMFDSANPCPLPGSSLIAQICGQNFQQTCGLQPISDKFLVKTSGFCTTPRCNGDLRDDTQPSCQCTGAPGVGVPLGTCTCLHWQRYSLKPTKFRSIADSEVCFSAPLRKGGIEERCIYLDMTVTPYSLTVSNTNNGASLVTRVTATVGQPLTLTVFSEDLNTYQTLSIDLQKSVTSKKPSVELPRQRWLSAGAMCANTAKSSASIMQPCVAVANRAVWKRQVVYTPLISESGMTYEIYFQATDNGVSQALLHGTEGYTFMETLGGSACGPDLAGLCSNRPKSLIPAGASIVVEVQQVQPQFVDTPDEGALASAYPNCPMPMVPVKVWKSNAAITLSLTFGPTPEDEAAGLKLASPEAFGFTSQSGCVQKPNDQHSYSCNKYTSNRADVAVLHQMTLQWTPPLEAAGAVYKVCVVAEDDAPSKATRCLTIEVSRCMYCSDTESLTHLATRFRTNWLQIWSSNDPEWVQMNQQNLQESQVKAWAATEFPHQVEKGTLIRLGPVYTTRAEHGFQELAQRFGTTLWALLELNPDLNSFAEDGAPIPIGQDVCVLPGICSASQGTQIDLP